MSTAILLSGGVDSTSLAYWKRPDYAISVDYGQAPSEAELRVAHYVANELGISHEVIRSGIGGLGTGLLADCKQVALAPTPEWWPFRNQFLVTLAAMFAIKNGVGEIMIGTVKSDTSHLDNAPNFIKLVDQLLSFQEGAIRVVAPAHNLTTIELVRASKIPVSLLGWTHSCHTGNLACGSCRGCLKRIEVFESLR